ncbi:MAG: GNAT family N-acetyltransferase, partial [Pseudomonadota bacterium]
YDPFLDWDFLEAMEASGSATPETGWAPHHVLAHDEAGKLVGALPLYVKNHSRGEFVFDYAWADALERAGGRYYPKLVSAIPFTPVAGRRRLATGPHAQEVKDAVLAAAVKLADANDLSSLHINFIDEFERAHLDALGLLIRQDQQFHWFNNGYESFDDFLAALASRKRKNLKKERATAQDAVRFEHLTGDQLTETHWDIFFRFYVDTGDRKWGTPYLTRDAFSLLSERMADKILLILAYDGDRPIAGAMNLIGSEALYGRYWGRAEERPCLHFETCYYQAIDFAIANGLKRVEAGAQGGHKLARGYAPAATYSAHWIAHDGFRDAIAHYLTQERNAVSQDMAFLNDRTPF